METDRVIFRTQWLAVKESPRGFQYLERKGKDSVAVFLLRKGSVNPLQYEILIRQQHLCIDNREVDGTFTLFPCPITGGLNEFFTATTQNAQILGKSALFDYVFDDDRLTDCTDASLAIKVGRSRQRCQHYATGLGAWRPILLPSLS